MIRHGVVRSAVVLLAAFGASPALAQAPTFAELEGSVVEASVTEMRRVRTSEGKEGDQRAHHVYKLAIAAGGAIQYSQTVTTHRIQKGDSDSRTHSARSTLGQPHTWRDGKAVWVFENGALTHLRTLDQGGNLIKLTFARGAGGGLTCTASKAFAREDGVGSLQTKSTTHGVQRVEFLSSRQVGASCRVGKS
jgi:hypothetical protein